MENSIDWLAFYDMGREVELRDLDSASLINSSVCNTDNVQHDQWYNI